MGAIALHGVLALVIAAAAPAPAAVKASPVYDLATFTGVVHSTWARLTYDPAADEVYTVNGGLVRVYNDMGMQVHAFGGDDELGFATSVVVDGAGDLLVLSLLDGRRRVIRCDFRGEAIEELKLQGLPPALGAFEPDTMISRAGTLYLAQKADLRVVVTDERGAFRRAYELRHVLKLDPSRSVEGGMGGFDVDPHGNLVFTVPSLSSAFVVSPGGQVRRFGSRGSSPGKFNIAGAIAADERGRYFLSDRLRSVVMVFSDELQFQGEFGYRGEGSGSLVTPFDVAAGNGKVFVAQAGGRGVRVFRITESPPGER